MVLDNKLVLGERTVQCDFQNVNFCTTETELAHNVKFYPEFELAGSQLGSFSHSPLSPYAERNRDPANRLADQPK